MIKQPFVLVQCLVLCALAVLCSSCSPAIADKNAANETIQQTKTETTDGETGQSGSGNTDNNDARPNDKAREDTVMTDDNNAIVIRSKDDVQKLVVKKIKTQKAGGKFEPVHVIVPVTSRDDFKTAREYLGQLVGIASPFEVQVQNEIPGAVDVSFNVKSSGPMHIILSGKSGDVVTLGHVNLNLSGDVVEIRHLAWRSIQEGHSIIKISDSREVILDDVVFDDVKANDLPLPSDEMIAVNVSDAFEHRDATLTFKNCLYKNVSQRVAMRLGEKAREAYAKVTFDHVVFDHVSFSSAGLDVSVRENVLIRACTVKGVTGGAVFSQSDKRAAVVIEDSELSGHVYDYDPPQAKKDEKAPDIAYKNNKVADDATVSMGYGVSLEKIPAH